MLLRKKKPVLIPIVGIRVKGKHKKLEEEEAQVHNTKVYYLVCKYKDKVALEGWAYIQCTGEKNS